MVLSPPKFWKESPVDNVPVIPRGTFFSGHLHLLLESDFQKSLYNFSVAHADDQGRCTFWMGPTTPALSVTQSEDVQTLLKVSSHRELFPLMEVHMEKFFGRYNIGVLTGKEWKSKRSAIIKALHGQNRETHNKMAFQEAANIFVKRFKVIEYVDDISLYMKMLTLDSFGLACLSKDFGCCSNLKPSRIMKDFEYMSSEVMRRMMSLSVFNPASHVYQLPTKSNKKYNVVMNRMDDFLLDIIDERATQIAHASNNDDSVPKDLLTSMIKEYLLNSGEEFCEESMDQMLVDTMKSLLFAGYETTSVTLTYVLYLLSKHQDVEKRCIEEITTKSNDLVYMDAVIQETLRLFPPVISTTRMLEKDVRFSNLHVPEGTYLYFPIWTIQRDERHFKWPLKFIPERWARLDESKSGKWVKRTYNEANMFEGVPAGNPKAFVAFSSGARSCAGQRFAVQEVKTLLTTLLTHFKFVIPDDYILTLHRHGFVQCPKDGLPVTIERRQLH